MAKIHVAIHVYVGLQEDNNVDMTQGWGMVYFLPDHPMWREAIFWDKISAAVVRPGWSIWTNNDNYLSTDLNPMYNWLKTWREVSLDVTLFLTTLISSDVINLIPTVAVFIHKKPSKCHVLMMDCSYRPGRGQLLNSV